MHTRAHMVAKVLAACASLVLAVACGGSSEPTTASGDSEVVGAWSAKLTCDGGAAVIDADRADARHVQMVVREPHIVSFLSSKVNHIQNLKGEVILEGWADDPASFTDDQGHFDYQQISETLTKRVVGVVHREDGERVRLVFQRITTTRSCSGYIEEHDCRNGQWTVKDDVEELANWGFQSCR